MEAYVTLLGKAHYVIDIQAFSDCPEEAYRYLEEAATYAVSPSVEFVSRGVVVGYVRYENGVLVDQGRI